MILFIFTLFLVAFPVFAAERDKEEKGGLFSDVPETHWAKTQIELAVQKGYVRGFPDGTFRPDGQVTRAQFMRMLVDALQFPHSQGGQPWYQPYVAALIETGIHKEKDFSRGYDEPLLRMEMARLAVRAIDPNLQASNDPMEDNLLIYEAAKKGIIHGVGRGVLAPDGYSTRAQAVAVIERVLAVHEGKTLPVDEEAVRASQILMSREVRQ